MKKIIMLILLALFIHTQVQGQKDNLGKVLLSIDIDHVSIFVNHVYDDAKLIADSLKIPIAIIIGVSALETKYSLSRRCEEDNNYFGIKRNHEFMVYENMQESFRDFGKVMCQKCYKDRKPETLLEWEKAILECNYAGKDNYSYITKLNNIIFRYSLDLL